MSITPLPRARERPIVDAEVDPVTGRLVVRQRAPRLVGGDRLSVQVEVTPGADLLVWVDGTARPLTGESFLVALGADVPWWFTVVHDLQQVLDHNPGLPLRRWWHYLSRPRADRQVLIRAAFAGLGTGTGPRVPRWLWFAFGFDPHASVRATFTGRLKGVDWSEDLAAVAHAHLDVYPEFLSGHAHDQHWHALPASLQARVEHVPPSSDWCAACA